MMFWVFIITASELLFSWGFILKINKWQEKGMAIFFLQNKKKRKEFYYLPVTLYSKQKARTQWAKHKLYVCLVANAFQYSHVPHVIQ